MFTYFHCYLPETWEAQIKAGLINQSSGVRFVQCATVPEDKSFNRLAAVGGELYHIIRELGCPMYIDRLQGGGFFENYQYDQKLVQAYKEMLGDKFFGFQMHEWMSNYRSDLDKLLPLRYAEWTEKTITDVILQRYPYPYVFIESMSVSEMAEHPWPKDTEEFIEVSKWLFAKRQKCMGGDILPCDSCFMAAPIELLFGAKRLMVEIGAQTADTRIQLAYTRGMARSAGLPYGAYTEPWGGSDSFSAACYHREGLNEWGEHGENFPFQTAGENGGSSLSLFMRMQLYAYMAGVSFISEEWGMCNTFYDWHDCELTPYGIIKRDFIRFTERYPNIGTPVMPIAVVLPKELPVLQTMREYGLMALPTSDEMNQKLDIVRNGLKILFKDSEPMIGNSNETEAMRNCRFPDVLDIVNEDHLHAEYYDYLIDLTGASSLSAAYPKKICEINELPDLLDRLLPCKITGGAMKQFTRTEDGRYYVMLLNNSGVSRSVANGEQLLHEADTVVTAVPNGSLQLTGLEGNASVFRTEDGVYHIDIPAGGWFFGMLV